MYPMQINLAQQLVADRRTSFESVAARRRLRHRFAHRSENVTPNVVEATRVSSLPVGGRRDRVVAEACTRSVA